MEVFQYIKADMKLIPIRSSINNFYVVIFHMESLVFLFCVSVLCEKKESFLDCLLLQFHAKVKETEKDKRTMQGKKSP